MTIGSPLSILHVTPSYVPATAYGGPPQSVHALARGLAQAGHRVVVATTNRDGPGNLDVQLGQPVSVEDVEVYYFPCGLRRLYLSLPLWRFVRQAARRFDLIHLHSVYLFPTSVGGWAARRARKPYILSPRGMLVPELIDRKNRWLKRGWLRFIERPNIRGAHLHFATDHECAQFNGMGLPGRSQYAIPNIVSGPDTDLLRDLFRDRAKASDQRYLLYLGRLDPIKNIDQAILALKHLSPDIMLRIVGPDPIGYANTLRNLIDSHQLSLRVTIEPTVDAAKWELLAGATAVILMSDSESFGNVVVEAASVGTPAIVSQGVGCAKQLIEAGAGAPARTPESIAQAVARLTAQPDTAVRCREFAQRFGPDILVPRYLEMYRAALCN